jgi:hypothetical protein
MAVLERLQALELQLDQVIAKAGLASAEVRLAAAAADQAVTTMAARSTQLGEIGGQAASARLAYKSTVDEIGAIGDEALRRMSATSTQIVDTAGQARASVEQSTAAIESATNVMRDHLTERLSELRARLNTEENEWDRFLENFIESVELGQQPLEKLLNLYGEARIGGETLREFIGAITFDPFARRLRDFIESLRAGQASLQQILDLLGKTQNLVAQQFLKVIELFRQGKATIQDIYNLVVQIQRQVPDSQFAELADAIADALRDGTLS